MKKTLLSAASVLALLASGPVYAETKIDGNEATGVEKHHSDAIAKGEVYDAESQKNWEKTKQAVSDAADDVSDAASDAADDIRAAFVDDDGKADVTMMTFHPRNTVAGMVGQTVYNGSNESVGKIHDIIFDTDGNAAMVIVADGEIFGLGKKVAFDYSVIANRNADGDVIAPLTEAMIDQATEFSYDRNATGEKVRVMPANAYSANTLLGGQLVNASGDVVAEIDNITLRNGAASQLIVGFDKVMGFGGNKAALNYNAAELIHDGSEYDFRLSNAQTAQFETFKKATN